MTKGKDLVMAVLLTGVSFGGLGQVTDKSEGSIAYSKIEDYFTNPKKVLKIGGETYLEIGPRRYQVKPKDIDTLKFVFSKYLDYAEEQGYNLNGKSARKIFRKAAGDLDNFGWHKSEIKGLKKYLNWIFRKEDELERGTKVFTHTRIMEILEAYNKWESENEKESH
jgi:hypothetical protein